MNMLNINWGYIIVQLLIFGTWPFFSLIGLFALRRSHITGINQFLWASLIVVVPVLGALAFLILRPAADSAP
jgi:hypothetical protein